MRRQPEISGTSTNNNNNNNNDSKKSSTSSSKSRRRLHEVEVISTTPCTAPLRKPKQDGGLSNIGQSSSLHRRGSVKISLDDDQQQQIPSNSLNSSSMDGTIREYSRISNRTGGFEGALPLQYDAIVFPDDDNDATQTLPPNRKQQQQAFESTSIQSSPEFGQRQRRSQQGGTAATNSRRLFFPLQRRLSFVDNRDDNKKSGNVLNSPSKQQGGFFQRWKSSSNGGNNVTSSTENNLSSTSLHTGMQQPHEKNKQTPSHGADIVLPKLVLRSKQEENHSQRSYVQKSRSKDISQPATPTRGVRALNSPRFVLPDETPPGVESIRNRNRKSKESDHTSAAIDANRSKSEGGGGQGSTDNEQGFELSISSAPPTFASTPTSQKDYRRATRRSLPVDLDEIDDESSTDDEVIFHKRAHTKREKNTNRQQSNRNNISNRAFSVSPSRRRTRNESVSPGRRSTNSYISSRSAHARLGVRLDSDDDLSKFSAQHLGGNGVSLKQSSSSLQSDWRYGLRKWVMSTTKRTDPTTTIVEAQQLKRTIDVRKSRTTRIDNNNGNTIISRDGDRRNLHASDELKSVSPDQRESIFANIELVDREIENNDSMRNRSTEKSTNYTQSTIASSKDATTTTATTGVKLPLCVVCHFNDRTHICIPCMHFAYCRECSLRIAKLGKGCAICQKLNVTFAEVSV